MIVTNHDAIACSHIVTQSLYSGSKELSWVEVKVISLNQLSVPH